MIDTETELRRIVAADLPHQQPPDLAGLTAVGRRRLRRRRTTTAVAAAAAMAVLAVPASVLSAPDRGDHDDPSTAGAVDEPAPPEHCALCRPLPPSAAPETRTLLGEPLVVGTQAGGVEEVLYAVRTRGTDLSTGAEGPVEVLVLGWREAGELYQAASTVQPGHDGVSPDGHPVRFWSSRSGTDDFVVVGYVDGSPAEVTWSTPAGDRGPVDASSTEVLEGVTVFSLTRPLPEGYEAPSYQRTTAPDGAPVIEIGPGGEFPPPLTIHTSDGWSCSLQDCGSLG